MKNASSKRLSEVIFNKLVERIKNDKYKVGDKLPSESVLAKEFEVSRYPIREALSKLASAGYIESFQGKVALLLIMTFLIRLGSMLMVDSQRKICLIF